MDLEKKKNNPIDMESMVHDAELLDLLDDDELKALADYHGVEGVQKDSFTKDIQGDLISA